MSKKSKLDLSTGEIVDGVERKLGVRQEIRSRRPNGTLRIQFDLSDCPSMAEQHTAHLSDVNYLVEKYSPDELMSYISARALYRQEILGYDETSELNLQDAMNVVAAARGHFMELPDDVRKHFSTPLEFIKFIDDPRNAEKMVAFGLISKAKMDEITRTVPSPVPPISKESSTPAEPA